MADKYTQAEIDKLGKAGKAFGPDSDGHYSYPIADREDLRNAIRAVGRGSADHDAIRKFIMRRAKHMGLSDLIPDNWNADGSLKDSKARWSGAQHRDARRGRVERRAKLAGTRETRQFRATLTSTPVTRSGSSTTGVTVSGTPIVYRRPYTVYDEMGHFSETMAPGVAASILSTCDTRFLFEHSGLPLARTSSGTMTLTDTPAALQMAARLDPRITLASDLIHAIERGDVSQMSCGFIVADDEWNADYSERTIHSFSELLDVSAVTYPASPTTAIDVEGRAGCGCCSDCTDDCDGTCCSACIMPTVPGRPQGDGDAPFPYGPTGTMGGDGSGSRSTRRLRRELLELDVAILAQPSRRK